MADIIGINLIKLDKVDSTNNYANNHLVDYDWKEGTVIVAEEQTLGRGLLNNSWESAPSKNLLASIVLYPVFLPPQYQFLISKVVALGMLDTLSLFIDRVSVKWPNDLYVGDRKIAGVLIENTLMGNVIQSSVAGIGININQKRFFSSAPNPVSLCQLLKMEIDLTEFRSLLFIHIDKWYAQLRNGNTDMINRTYLNNLYRIGQESEYSDSSGRFRGTISGVNETGQLIMIKSSGEQMIYHFKEVEFL